MHINCGGTTLVCQGAVVLDTQGDCNTLGFLCWGMAYRSAPVAKEQPWRGPRGIAHWFVLIVSLERGTIQAIGKRIKKRTLNEFFDWGIGGVGYA